MGERLDRVLINGDFARLWYGQAVSTVGTAVFDTTLVLWIATDIGKGKSWAPAAVAGVMIAMSAAMAVVGVLAGVYVDRWNRRRTMLRTEEFQAVLVGALAAVAFVPTRELPAWLWLAMLYVVVFGVNAAGMFFFPSRTATIADVVAEADVPRAASITEATSATASIIGPPLAAPFLFTEGIQWALVANALSYVVSWFAIRSVRTPDTSGGQGAQGSFRAEYLAGIRFFRSSRVLMALLVIGVIATLGTGALNTLDIFFFTGNLHATPKLFGVLSMIAGAGAVVGAVLSTAVVRRIGARATLWSMVAVAGAAIVLYSRQTGFAAAAVVAPLIMMPLAAMNAGMMPLLLKAAPREYLGRVVAVLNPVLQLTGVLSAVLAGVLMSTVARGFHASVLGVHVGPVDTVFSLTGVLFLIAALYGFLVLPREAAEPVPEPEPAAADA